jgi:hypothetical protein
MFPIFTDELSDYVKCQCCELSTLIIQDTELELKKDIKQLEKLCKHSHSDISFRFEMYNRD